MFQLVGKVNVSFEHLKKKHAIVIAIKAMGLAYEYVRLSLDFQVDVFVVCSATHSHLLGTKLSGLRVCARGCLTASVCSGTPFLGTT